MSIEPEEKIALFIDGVNLYATSKALGIDIDYKRFLDYYQNEAYVLRAYYFTTVTEDQEPGLRPLMDWLDYNGFAVETKQAKEFFDQTGRRRAKASINVELSMKAVELLDHYDHLVLFSGDGDFTAMVDLVQRKGKRVTVVSTLESDTPMVSDDLRRQADFFVDLNSIAQHFSRKS